jgi:hypothetical protein
VIFAIVAWCEVNAHVGMMRYDVSWRCFSSLIINVVRSVINDYDITTLKKIKKNRCEKCYCDVQWENIMISRYVNYKYWIIIYIPFVKIISFHCQLNLCTMRCNYLPRTVTVRRITIRPVWRRNIRFVWFRNDHCWMIITSASHRI